jgi:hypothetical protein
MKRGVIATILTITCLMMAFGVFQVSAQETQGNTGASTYVMNINGIMISQAQFNRELANELNKDPGKTFTEEDLKAKIRTVLEKITKSELLYQECEKNNISVTDDEINQKFDKEKSKFASEEEYLKSKNVDASMRKSEIKRELAIQRLINQKFAPTITDKEIEKYYKDNADKYQDVKLEQVKDEIKKQLGREKIADAYNQFYAELKSKAKIEVLLK